MGKQESIFSDYFESPKRLLCQDGPALGANGQHRPNEAGAGIILHCNSRGLMVVAGLVPAGPAEKSGKISINDILVSVNSVPVSLFTYEQVVDMLLGPVDSLLTLSFRPPFTEEQREVKLRRANLRSNRPREQVLIANLLSAWFGCKARVTKSNVMYAWYLSARHALRHRDLAARCVRRTLAASFLCLLPPAIRAIRFSDTPLAMLGNGHHRALATAALLDRALRPARRRVDVRHVPVR